MSACQDAFCEALRLDLLPPYWVIFLAIASHASFQARHFVPSNASEGLRAVIYRNSFLGSLIFNSFIDAVQVQRVLFASELAVPDGAYVSGLFLVLATSPNVSKAITMMALGSLIKQGNMWKKANYLFLEDMPELKDELERHGQQFAIMYVVVKYGIAIPGALGFVWCVPAFLAFFYVFLFINLIIWGTSECFKFVGTLWCAVKAPANLEAAGMTEDLQTEPLFPGEAPRPAGASPPEAAQASASRDTGATAEAPQGEHLDASASSPQAPEVDGAGASATAGAERDVEANAARPDHVPLLGGAASARRNGEQPAQQNAQAKDSQPSSSGEGGPSATRPPTGGIPAHAVDLDDLGDDDGMLDAVSALATGAPLNSWGKYYFASLETLALVIFAPLSARLFNEGYWTALQTTLWSERDTLRWIGTVFKVNSQEDAFSWVLAIRWLF